MAADHCPVCPSTNVAAITDSPDGKNAECLHCLFRWTVGGRSKRRTYPRNRLNDTTMKEQRCP